MAVASGAPMKMGSRRGFGACSRSRRMGVFVGQLDAHPDQIHLDHALTIAADRKIAPQVSAGRPQVRRSWPAA